MGTDAERAARGTREMARRLRAVPGLPGTSAVLAVMLLGLVVVQAVPALDGIVGADAYVPLHLALETSSIVIAALVFAASWSLRRTDRSHASLLVGSAFLFVAVTDFSHALSYPGMPDFVTPSGPEKAIHFWLVARVVAALALLGAVVLPVRPARRPAARYGPVVVFALLAAAVNALVLLRPEILPDVFVPGQGLTTFKVATEALIVVVNVASAALLVRRRRRAPARNDAALLGAICAMAMSEYLFTLYADMTDVLNLLGHVYKVVSYVFLYRAMFASGIEAPYVELEVSRGKLQGTLDALPDLLFEIDAYGRIYDVNEPCARVLGIRPEALAGARLHDYLGPGAAETLAAALDEAREAGTSRGARYELRTLEGPRWYEVSAARKGGAGGPGARFVVLSHDIAGLRSAELEVVRLANLYAGLIRANEAFVHAAAPRDLLPRICDEVVRAGGLSMAWFELDLGEDVPLRVASLRSPDPGLPAVESELPPELRTAVDTLELPLAVRAAADDAPVWCDDLLADPDVGAWRGLAERFGWRACVSLPLQSGGAVAGTVTLLGQDRGFHDRTRSLLTNLARDVDFALRSFDRERRRRETERDLADSRNLLATVLDTAPVRIFWKALDLRYAGCNLAFARDAGLRSPADVVGLRDEAMPWRDRADEIQASDLEVLATGEPSLAYEASQTRADGSVIWLRASKVPLRDAAGAPLGLLGVYEDITLSREAEQAVRRSEADLNVAQSIAQVGSWRYEVATGRVEASTECHRIFGLSAERLNTAAVLAALHPDDRDAVLDHARSGRSFECEFRILVDDHVRWVSARAKVQSDGDGRPQLVFGTAQDVTARKVFEDRVHYLAHFDTLTGLPNRSQLDDLLSYVLGRVPGGEQVTLMFLDLDHFKDVNDSLGHSVGDALLVQLAARLRSALRDEDVVSRLGGDEFIVMAPHTDGRRAAVVAQKLLGAMAEPYVIDDYELHLTASIGIALYPKDGTTLDTLSRSADVAMYRAKQDGRNCYRFFTPAMQERSARNLQLVNDLRHALDRDELRLVYQPQLAVADGRLVGVEALLRWTHPQLGRIAPAEFIPVAEDSGLILGIGEWVIRRAVAQLRSWRDDGLPEMLMAVNLSAVQFRHAELPQAVSRILAEEDVAPEHLVLELTEGVAMHDPRTAIDLMHNLEARGVRLAIDDFGTGYSSLSYLQEFSVYKLKVDQSFVSDLGARPENRAIVTTILEIARNLSLATIAEGVETAEQFAFLREQGCDEVQGFLLGRPMPPADLEAYVRGRGPWTGIDAWLATSSSGADR